MQSILTSSALLLGLILGAAFTYWMSRSRSASQMEAAVARAQGSTQTELAQLRERVRLGEASKLADKVVYDALKRQSETWRDALDAARDECSTLNERALRVPVLEGEAAELAERLRLTDVELLRVSTNEAQQAQSAMSLTGQVARLETSVADLAQQLAASSEALNLSNERKAALEEQVQRLPLLDAKLLEAETLAESLSSQLTTLRESTSGDISRLTAEVAAEREALTLVRGELLTAKSSSDGFSAEVQRLTGELTEMRTRMDVETRAAEGKLELLMEAKATLSDQFKSLATDILEEKSKRFAEQNQATIGQLLEPLKTQLSEFKGKVEEVYVNEGKDRSALSEQVKQLLELNHTLSADAKNLTTALKGSAKTQGNWGELILERVLELSGLRRGHEYHVQESQVREDSSRAQADVVINLPEDRRLVVDAKVSLVAYESHISAETDEARAQCVKRHLDSVRGHIKGLSGKQYQTLYGLKSLDFVLMFIPIEPAFMMAVTHDNDLFMEAWDKNVLLVSPSTLLFVVRTVAHLWRQEQQSRNSQDIAKRGAELYDRLVGFVEDLQKVGSQLTQAQTSYDSAFKKLATNKGNVIRQAEMLRDLGVKPSKALPTAVLARSTSEDNIIVVGNLAVLPTPSSPLHLAASDGIQLDLAEESSSAEPLV